MSIEYLSQQLGANEKILYTERHHWIFPIAEMIKWIIAAGIIIVLLVLYKTWFHGSWTNWLFVVLLVFVATLDQVNLGVWAVQEKYFRLI